MGLVTCSLYLTFLFCFLVVFTAPRDSALESTPEEPSAGAAVDHEEEVVKVVAPPSSLSDLKLPAPVLSMLRKLSK